MAKKKQSKLKKAPDFKKGDLVGAKVKGHPIWPGQIEEVDLINNRKRYTVRFFKTNDTSQTIVQLKLFADLTPQEKLCKRKDFQEALALCQEKYDSLNKTSGNNRVIKGNSQGEHPSPQHSSASVQQETTSPSLEEEDEDEGKLDIDEDQNDLEIDQSNSSLPPPKKPKLENGVDETFAQSLNQRSEQQHQQSKSPRSEGENVMQASHREQTIAKLQDKLAAKLREKEALKQTLRDKRTYEKVAKNFPAIHANLDRLSKVFQKISSSRNLNQFNGAEWKSASRRYQSSFKVLIRCIEFFKSDCGRRSDECKQCHKILTEVAENLKAARQNAKLPLNLQKELKEFMKGMKANATLKDFINNPDNFGNYKNAMTERKENDAAKLK